MYLFQRLERYYSLPPFQVSLIKRSPPISSSIENDGYDTCVHNYPPETCNH